MDAWSYILYLRIQPFSCIDTFKPLEFSMYDKVKAIFAKAIDSKIPHYSDMQPLFRKTTTFENKTDETIVTLDRNNIPVTYKNNPNRFKGEQVFIVRITYEFLGREMAKETLLRLHEFQSRFKVQDENHLLIEKLLQDSYDRNPTGNIHVITIERHIHLDDLKRYKCIYEEGSDYLVNCSEGWLTAPHPHSQEGRTFADHSHYVSGKKVSGCLIEVVDNDNKIGNRYVYCAKQLIKLNPVKDMSRQSGVYFTQFENCEHEADKIDPHFMDFQQAQDNLGLYKTEEEATTGGAPEELAKKKTAEALKELERIKLDAAQEQARNKVKEAALAAELLSLKTANEVLKERLAENELKRTERERQRKEEYAEREDKRKDKSQQRNDYYEDRSQYRKDTSESTKWIPTLLVGAMGIAMGVAAFFLK